MRCFEKQVVEPPIKVEDVQESVVKMAVIELKNKVVLRKVKLGGRK